MAEMDSLKISFLAVGADKAARDIKKVSDAVAELQETESKAETGNSVVPKAIDQIGEAAAKSTPVLLKLKMPLEGFLKQLGRVAKYRMLRGILTGIAKGFTEGIKNMYQWNKALGGEFAAAMDSLASSATTFKNSLAVASAPLIEHLAPLVATLAAQFADLATNVSRFFAILTGSDHYYEASTASVTAYGNAAGAAAKKVRTLLKFDEINRLEEKNKGGGGGSSGTYSGGGFKRVDLPKNLKDMTLLSRLKLAIEEWDFNPLGNLFKGDNFLSKLLKAIGVVSAWIVLKSIGFGKLGISLAGILLGLSIGSALVDALGIKNTFGGILLKGLVAALVGGAIASLVLGPAGWVLGIAAALVLTIASVKTEEGKAAKDNFVKDFKEKMTPTFSNDRKFPIWWVGDVPKLGVPTEVESQVNKVTATESDGSKKGFVNWLKEHFGKGSVNNTTDVTVTDVNATEASGVSKNVSLWLNNKYKHWTVPTYVDLEIKQVTVSGKKDVTLDVGGYRDKNGNVKNEIMLKGMASGGFLNQGDVFVAREAGPEMVGQIGNRTAVANNDQIVQGIASGVASANAQQNALLREQNALLRDILNKGTNITTGSISSAFERMNRREGSTVIAVGG